MSKEKPNITLNFYGSVGQQIANVENQTIYVGKDGNISIANVEKSTPNPSPFTPNPNPTTVPSSSAAGLPFKYIHPSITDDAEQLQITREIQNLVRTQPLPDICHYLMDMKKANRIYLNLKPEAAFAELHRMGMPDETHKGFSYKNFTKYYNVN